VNRGAVLLLWAASGTIATAASGHAQEAAAETPGPALALSFADAQERLEHTSPALSGVQHGVNAAREVQAAVATMHRPIVTASAQYLAYQKTLSVDLSGPKQETLQGVDGYLSALPGQLPPAFQEIASGIVGRISQALPGLFSAIPDTLTYRYRDEVFNPTVQGVLPLYSGGAIPAVQHAAAAGVDLAQARVASARDTARLNLVRVYFGQMAAHALALSARRSRDALASLARDVAQSEQAGVTPHATTLEAGVARDTAERAYQRALLEEAAAQDELALTLEASSVQPTTPLFVRTRALEPVDSYVDGDRLPRTREADAGAGVAKAGVELARARYRPQAFAFGAYNFNRDHALPTEPDWVVGVGARITLLSNVDRGHLLASAREQEAAAQDAAREARRVGETAVHRAWTLTEAARRSFVLLDSSLAAAQENLRVRRVSFAEGESTLTAVLGAEAALSAARTQRIATAYEYDLALAGLLAASGRLDRLDDAIATADVRLLPEPQTP
jgi:outer membrane protein TolC